MVMKYKGKTLTAEQESHVKTVLDGDDYAVQAPPGSGKTFLLLSMARKLSGYGLSLSFNKLLAVEAAKKFSSSVTCKTGHALAYGSVGYKYSKRLKKLTGKQLADNFEIGDWKLYNNPSTKGYLILNTIRKYCYSSDRQFKAHHLPRITILDEGNLELMKADILENSKNIFEEMTKLDSKIPITHDVYLKIWALTNPVINKDYIFFDEYQDSNPVIADVIKRQSCQKIFVGDQFQQIYAWRGAVNALQNQDLNKLHITRSFRFGEAIAGLSNSIIKSYYPYEFDYKDFHGNDDIESSVHYEPIGKVDCILCRTNKGVIAETIKALDKQLSVHILGGTKQITYLINSIIQLKIRGYSNHPDLLLFSSFLELKEYANSPMGGDLKPILKLIEMYGRDKLINILESTTDLPEEADITIATAHKSKGLEWPNVKLANDFKLPQDRSNPTNEETNILYVAASRALNKLDLSECEAAWKQTFDLAKQISYEQHLIDQAAKQETNDQLKLNKD
jgi:superfamily I DNA/RNA helicase